MSNDPQRGPGVSGLEALALVGQLGTIMVVCILGGVFGGVALSRWTGAKWLLIPPVFIGIMAGIYGVYRILEKEAEWKH